ncbi:MAG: hypothetical protein GX970_12050 [Phyllobacteriaceae bacterium]|nr:hypothetical protein [Phyllobacteriaceae bacterium]
MRIDGTNRTNGVAGRSSVGRSGNAPAFVPAGDHSVSRAAGPAAMAPTAGIEAILALQTVGDFSESRRRAVQRGRTLLDLLDDMKTDLLIGSPSPERLDAMVQQLSAMRERVEPGIDAVIDDIELRVRVELAKQGHFPQF